MFPSRPVRQWLPLWLLLALVVGFALQGTRGLYDTTEGRYAEVAREMLASGDWQIPRLEGHPHLSKPPLTYWAIAVGMAVLGRNEWGVRLYAALAFAVAVAAVAALGTRLWDAETGWLAGLIYATALFPAAAANVASTDVLLTMWELLAVLAYWSALRAPAGGARLRMRGMWLAFGFAFFTKGYPALLPLVSIAVFHGLQRRRGEAPPRLFDPAGIALFLVAGFWWYLAIILLRPGTLDYFIRDELLARLASNHFHRNPEWYKPLVLYGPALTLGLGLWLAAWPVALRWRGPLGAAWRDLWRRSEQTRFLVWWLGIPLVVLSLSQSRLPLYILPFCAVPVLATARLLASRGTAARHPRLLLATALLSAALVVGVKGLVAAMPVSSDARALARNVSAAAGPRGTVLSLDQDMDYGLTFYRQGDLRRVASSSVHRGALTLGDAVADAQAGNFALPVVFVAGHPYADLERACAAPGASCTRDKSLRGTVLYTFGAP